MAKKKAFLFALRHTYPIFFSWLPIALAYGLIMRSEGYNFLWTGLCSAVMYCGSFQMVLAGLFNSTVSYFAIFLTALAVNFRHIFFGLSLLDRYKKFGAWQGYLIYTLCDELYSLFCSYEVPEDTDEKWAHVFTAMLLHFYWTALTMAGAALGAALPFDLTGIDFALTALFTCIVLDMLRAAATPLPALVAMAAAVGCLLIFGGSNFLIPALLIMTAALLALRRPIEAKEVAKA